MLATSARGLRMKQPNQDLIQALTQLRQVLNVSQPLEQQIVDQAVTFVETHGPAIEAQPELKALFAQFLAGLRTLQSGPTAATALAASIDAALDAALQFLKGDDDSAALVQKNTQALTQLLDDSAQATAAASPETVAVDSEEEEMLANLINEFLVESYENLDQLDRDLITLEQDPSAKSTLASIFRTIHTIKGTCGFFGFSKLEAVTHVGENLLSRLRDGRLQLNAERTTGLLALVDAVRQMLGNIETARSEGDADYSPLIAMLTELNQDAPATAPVVATAQTKPAPPPPAPALANQGAGNDTNTGANTGANKDANTGTNKGANKDISQGCAEPELLLSSASAPLVLTGSPVIPANLNPASSAKVAPAALSETAKVAPAALSETAKIAPNQAAKEALTSTAPAGSSVADNNIRVDVGLLDVLMNLVGELVLARNQILQYTATQTDASFATTTQRLNLITSELQEGVMKTRLQPIGNIWNKFPRVVRDLAVACGKKIAIEITGKETEMDKTIIEAIKDPLTHLVRNSADHGIELPEVRLQRGKPAEGRIHLRAYHEGGQVNIEISDDGAGIDPAKLKLRAQERGLITGEQAARMNEREAINLIFLPGFSTAEKVTNISGRGVGMDVVRTNIEKIGGTLDIQSTLGAGSTIKIKIPLTLAIIPALLITSGGERFAIPQVSLLELVRLENEQARASIELIHGVPVYRLRGKLLPLVYLNKELRIGGDRPTTMDEKPVNIVVLRSDERQFGLVVDAINDTEEIVVKPLGKQLKGLKTYSGATIMGDGKVALILDVTGLAQQAGVVSTVRDRSHTEAETQTREEAQDRQTLLLFTLGTHGRMAMPLAQVARLEEITADSIERAGQQEVVQYRGQIMPLLRLSEIFHYNDQNTPATDLLPVIVYSGQTRSIGLVVDQIVDIVEEAVTNQHNSQRQGVLGTAIIQQRVTELLDVPAIIQVYASDWSQQAPAATIPFVSDGCQNNDSRPSSTIETRKTTPVSPTALAATAHPTAQPAAF